MTLQYIEATTANIVAAAAAAQTRDRYSEAEERKRLKLQTMICRFPRPFRRTSRRVPFNIDRRYA